MANFEPKWHSRSRTPPSYLSYFLFVLDFNQPCTFIHADNVRSVFTIMENVFLLHACKENIRITTETLI